MENMDFEQFFDLFNEAPPKEFLMELFRYIEKKKLREINDLKLVLFRKKFLGPEDLKKTITYDITNGQEQIEFLEEHRKKLAKLLEENLVTIKTLENRIKELENEIKINADMRSDPLE